MFTRLNATLVALGWKKAPEQRVSQNDTTPDPITVLGNRSQWAYEGIKSSIDTLVNINNDAVGEINIREEAKNKILAEQVLLRAITNSNGDLIGKAKQILDL